MKLLKLFGIVLLLIFEISVIGQTWRSIKQPLEDIPIKQPLENIPENYLLNHIAEGKVGVDGTVVNDRDGKDYLIVSTPNGKPKIIPRAVSEDDGKWKNEPAQSSGRWIFTIICFIISFLCVYSSSDPDEEKQNHIIYMISCIIPGFISVISLLMNYFFGKKVYDVTGLWVIFILSVISAYIFGNMAESKVSENVNKDLGIRK